eukprot:6098328-Alexandrium_andersonii.AAC.1
MANSKWSGWKLVGPNGLMVCKMARGPMARPRRSAHETRRDEAHDGRKQRARKFSESIFRRPPQNWGRRSWADK